MNAFHPARASESRIATARAESPSDASCTALTAAGLSRPPTAGTPSPSAGRALRSPPQASSHSAQRSGGLLTELPGPEQSPDHALAWWRRKLLAAGGALEGVRELGRARVAGVGVAVHASGDHRLHGRRQAE